MSIRRKESGTSTRKPRRAPLQSCIDAGRAMQESRDAVGHIFVQTAGEIEEEVARARAVFAQAECSLTGCGSELDDAIGALRKVSQSAFGKTSAAAVQGEKAAQAATEAMMARLNQISNALANAANQAPGSVEPTQ